MSLEQSVPTSGLFILGSFWEILSHLDVDVSLFKYVVTDHAIHYTLEKSCWGGEGWYGVGNKKASFNTSLNQAETSRNRRTSLERSQIDPFCLAPDFTGECYGMLHSI